MCFAAALGRIAMHATCIASCSDALLVHAAMARACDTQICIVLHCIFIDNAYTAPLATKASAVTAVAAVYCCLLAQESLYAATKKTFFNQLPRHQQ